MHDFHARMDFNLLHVNYKLREGRRLRGGEVVPGGFDEEKHHFFLPVTITGNNYWQQSLVTITGNNYW